MPDKRLQPLLIMGASPELTSYVMSILSPPVIGSNTIYTPFGKNITATLYQDYSQQEIAAISLYFVLEHPYASLVNTATHLYNCHSFAWHRQNEYNNVWVNCTDAYYNYQLSRYWTNDLYVPCSQQQADIVFYNGADHSGVVLSDGSILSKWGPGPLMNHDLTDCPYLASDYLYFKERTDIPLNTIQIYGEDHLSPGQGSLYLSNISHGSSIDYSWSITSYPNDPNCPEPSMNNGLFSEYAQVTFFGEGLYIIRAEASTANTPDSHSVSLRYGEKYVYVY